MVTLPPSVEAPATDRLVSAVVPPTAPPNVVAPVPVLVRLNAPSTAPVRPSVPVPEATVRLPPSVVIPATDTLLLVVVSVSLPPIVTGPA